MGASPSTLWHALTGPEPGRTAVVLNPPLFKPAGVSGRSLAAKSSFATAFRPAPLKALLGDYAAAGDTVVARLLLTPPGAEELLVAARVATGHLGASAAVSLRLQLAPHAFSEVKLSDKGARLRAAALLPSGLGVFGAVGGGAPQHLGLRVSTQQLGAGVALQAPWDGRHTAWLLARTGRLTAGLERVSSAADVYEGGTDPLALLRRLGVSAALAFRPVPAAVAILEVSRDGRLALSFLQHLCVRRRCKNPFEADSVVGIANFVDVGLRIDAPLDARGLPLAFALAAAWQLNKNVLLKARLSSAACDATLALRTWWLPAATAALTASHAFGDALGLRYGLSAAVDNVGWPRFERAEAVSGAAAVRRVVATAAERAAAGPPGLVAEAVRSSDVETPQPL